MNDVDESSKQIFFSYGHDKNKEIVDKLLNDIVKKGYEVWIDYKDIGVWEDWRGEIIKGISKIKIAIAYLSKHSVSDPGVCLNEIAILLDKGKKVYPVLLEPSDQCTPPVSISYLQFLDLSDWEYKKNTSEFDKWYEEKLKIIIDLIKKGKDFSGDLSLLKEVLDPINFTIEISSHIDNFVGRDLVFKEYDEWLKKDSRLLWLTGGPGFGKTAIAANLIHKHPSGIIASWFCSASSNKQKDPIEALKTISYQLAYRLPGYLSFLKYELGLYEGMSEQTYKTKKESLKKLGKEDLFKKLFSPLTHLIPLEEKLAVVIDGIDEATNEEGNNPIADLISQHLTKLPKCDWLSFIATSRPETSVIKYLQGFKASELDIRKEKNEKDLKDYLIKEFSKLKETKDLQADKKKEIIDTLTEKSEGIILYLKEVIDGLKHGTINLDNINDIPKGLYVLYNSQFESRFGNRYEEHVKPILRLIIASVDPIPKELVRLILNYDREEFNKKLNLIGSYIKETNNELTIYHKALSDWLTDDKTSGVYFIDKEEGDKEIGEYLYESFNNNFICQNEKHKSWVDIPYIEQIENHLPIYMKKTSYWEDGKNPVAYQILGWIRFYAYKNFNDDWDEALIYFDKAFELYSNSPNVYKNKENWYIKDLAMAYINFSKDLIVKKRACCSADFKKIIKSCDKVVSLNSNDRFKIYALCLKSYALCFLYNFREAIDTYNEAKNKDIESEIINKFDNINIIGGSKKNKIKIKDKIKELEKIYFILKKCEEETKLYPKNIQLYKKKATLFFKFRNCKKSLNIISEIINMGKADDKIYVLKGYILSYMHKYKTAKEAYYKAKELNPNNKKAQDGIEFSKIML